MSIRRNTLYNLAGSLTPLVVTLTTVPLFLNLIGEERFGVLTITWLLLGYFGLFDLGLSRATAQRIATLKDAEPECRAETFWTALFLNVGFGILGGFLIWPAAYVFFSKFFPVSENLRPEIISAIPWLLAAVPVATVSGVLSGALEGRERFLVINIVNFSGTVLFQVLPLLVAFFYGPDLTWLLLAALLGKLMTFSLLFLHCRRHVPLSGRPRLNRALIAPLFRFGGWVTVTSMISPILSVLDRIIIGALVGAKAVTYYSIPFSLTNRITVIPASLAGALFPRLATATGVERDRLSEDAVRILAVIITPIIIVGLLIMDPFLIWWINIEFASKAAIIGKILLLGLWANCFARIPFTSLQAQGRPDLVAKCHLAELPPYLAAMALVLPRWGIVGAALIWSIRVTFDFLLLIFFSGAAEKSIRILMIPLFLIGIAAIAVFFFPFGSLSGLVLVFTSLLLCLLWAWLNLPPQLKIYLPDRLHKVVTNNNNRGFSD